MTNNSFSLVTDMSGAFENLDFNQDINCWETGSVTSMYDMFWENEVFNSEIGQW